MKSKHKKLISRVGGACFTTLVGLSLYSIYMGESKTKIVSIRENLSRATNERLPMKAPETQTPLAQQNTAHHVNEAVAAPVIAPLSLDKAEDPMDSILTPDDGRLSGVSADLAPSVIADILGSDDQIIKAFRIDDLNAWIIREGQSNEVAVHLTTLDNRILFSGSFLYKMKNGETADLNEQIASRYSFNLGASAQWDLLTDSSYIQEGADESEGKKTVYAFFDPDCRFCHLSWLAFKPYVDVGDVDLRWVPVALLNKDSKSKVANLFQSPDPLSAFTRAHLAWDFSSQQSPFEKAGAMDVESAFKVEKNNQYLKDFDIHVTPSFVYKDEQDKVTVASGAIRLKDIPKLLNVEEIKNNDPRLALLRQKE